MDNVFALFALQFLFVFHVERFSCWYPFFISSFGQFQPVKSQNKQDILINTLKLVEIKCQNKKEKKIETYDI